MKNAITKRMVLIASAWIIGVYGISQLIRLGSNIFLTRILEPEMFGVMAVVAVVTTGLIMFSDLGLWTFVVRHKNGEDPHLLNVVWTIQVARGWAMFGLLSAFVAISYLVKYLFNINYPGIYNEDIFYVLILLAGATSVISGYSNLAPAVISRSIKRGKLELIELSSQVIGTAIMISWAIVSPTIWALSSAMVAAPITKLVLLKITFKFKHRLVWDKNIAKEVYDFGKWIVLASALTYISQQADRLYFGAYITTTLLGVYSIAFMINMAIFSVMQQLVFKIWFPVLSRAVNDDKNILKVTYYKIRQKQDLLLLPIAGALYFLSDSIIDFLYDDRYQEAGWVLQVLSLSLIGQSLSMIGLECLSAIGVTKYRVKVMFVRSIGMIVGLPVSFYLYSFEGAVYCVAINVFLGLPIIFWELRKNNILSLFLELRYLPSVYMGYLIAYYISKL